MKSTSINCPKLEPTILIGDNPYLLAQISSLVYRKNGYLPILDGPRMGRPDADSEIIRRNNAIARAKSKMIIFAGLPTETVERFPTRIKRRSTTYIINNLSELNKTPVKNRKVSESVLQWGKDKVGLGLLQALRQKKAIKFSDKPSTDVIIPSESGHLVVCEEGNELAQVIAANYAFALGAGLCLFPAISKTENENIFNTFYDLYNNEDSTPTSLLKGLKSKIRILTRNISTENLNSITFITNEFPVGFAYPEIPSSHLFLYPDLGISVINGITSALDKSNSIKVAVLIDPGEINAKETKSIIDCLKRRAVFIKSLSFNRATVRNAAYTIDLYPYDLLVISTHCGDADGWRWTYDYTDSEGIKRKLVIDLAICIEDVDEDEKYKVLQYTRFVSLDGVPWNDPEKKEKLHVGKAIIDYLRMSRKEGLEPTKKEAIDRVNWSSALKMYDGNYLAMPRSLADEGTPIIINNACASIHRLASTFMFENARAYIGTLFSVTDTEAQEVIKRLFSKHFGKPLSVALWRSQNEIYDNNVRRPYILYGVHFQKLETIKIHAPYYIYSRLKKSYRYWKKQLENARASDEHLIQEARSYLVFLKEEIEGIYERWLK